MNNIKDTILRGQGESLVGKDFGLASMRICIQLVEPTFKKATVMVCVGIPSLTEAAGTGRYLESIG